MNVNITLSQAYISLHFSSMVITVIHLQMQHVIVSIWYQLFELQRKKKKQSTRKEVNSGIFGQVTTTIVFFELVHQLPSFNNKFNARIVNLDCRLHSHS